jgi:hypothetical protein
MFLFTTASRTALGPTQPPIQWVPGAFSLEVKRPGREADHSRPSSAEVKEWVDVYLHSPNTPSWRCAHRVRSRDSLLVTSAMWPVSNCIILVIGQVWLFGCFTTLYQQLRLCSSKWYLWTMNRERFAKKWSWFACRYIPEFAGRAEKKTEAKIIACRREKDWIHVAFAHWLNNVTGRSLLPKTTARLSIYRKTKTWTTVKETTGRMESWGQNRSFIGDFVTRRRGVMIRLG